MNGREYEYADYYKNEVDTYEDYIGYSLRLFDADPSTSLSYVVGDTTVNELLQILAYTDLEYNITSVAIPGYDTIIPSSLIVPLAISGVISDSTARAYVVTNGYLSDNWEVPLRKQNFWKLICMKISKPSIPTFIPRLFH